MPRLQGERSSTGLYITLVIVLLLVVFLLLEFLGTIDLIPNFGA